MQMPGRSHPARGEVQKRFERLGESAEAIHRVHLRQLDRLVVDLRQPLAETAQIGQ